MAYSEKSAHCAPVAELSADVLWYAVMTEARCEFRAKAALGDRGVSVFLPWVACPLRGVAGAGRRALFPRYLFAGLPAGLSLSRINDADHVATVVRCGASPLPVPGPVMAGMMAGASEEGEVVLPEPAPAPGLRPGQDVWFRSGPFSGFAAVVETIDSHGRARVSFQVFGRSTMTLAPVEDLGADGPAPAHRRRQSKRHRDDGRLRFCSGPAESAPHGGRGGADLVGTQVRSNVRTV